MVVINMRDDYYDQLGGFIAKAIDEQILADIEREAMEENEIKAQAIQELDQEDHDKAVRDMKHTIREKRGMSTVTKSRLWLAGVLNPELKKKETPDELNIGVWKDGVCLKTWFWEQDHDGHKLGLNFPVYKDDEFLGDYHFDLVINKPGTEGYHSTTLYSCEG